MAYIKQDQKTGGDTNGQAKNINERVKLISKYISDCYFNIVAYHNFYH